MVTYKKCWPTHETKIYNAHSRQTNILNNRLHGHNSNRVLDYQVQYSLPSPEFLDFLHDIRYYKFFCLHNLICHDKNLMNNISAQLNLTIRSTLLCTNASQNSLLLTADVIRIPLLLGRNKQVTLIHHWKSQQFFSPPPHLALSLNSAFILPSAVFYTYTSKMDYIKGTLPEIQRMYKKQRLVCSVERTCLRQTIAVKSDTSHWLQL